MLKVGLTGGIGSGKSTISNMLKEKGLMVIDADLIAREVLKEYPQILEKVKEAFGNTFFNDKGELKRKEFGNFLFQNEERLKKYEKIILPFITKKIFDSMTYLEDSGEDLCIVDAATLIENGIYEKMDINILVWTDLKVQIERVKRRDKLTEEQVKNRIYSQMSLEEKKEFVDFIIDNSGEIEQTKLSLDKILKNIDTKYRGVDCLKM
jgi:dephospho-CoA kinase